MSKKKRKTDLHRLKSTSTHPDGVEYVIGQPAVFSGMKASSPRSAFANAPGKELET